jgi:transposase
MSGAGELSREDLFALIGELRSVNAALRVRVEEQDARIAVLEAEVSTLKRALGRNSSNSSMPPSGDDQPGRPAPKPRPGSGGKRGKRPGAPGSGLAWRAVPDDTIGHFPHGTCGCGADLGGARDEGVVASHQVHDVPLTSVKVIQHDLHQVRCACGRAHVGARPDEAASSPTSYGANLRALVVYLLVFQHLPVERCAMLIADLTGAQVSTGWVHSMLTRAGGAVGESVKLFKALITAAAVVGFDETTIRAGIAGTKKYVLSASTDKMCVFGLGGRDLDSFTQFAVLPEFKGIAIHDRYSHYDNPKVAPGVAGHQLCTAHLIRDLTDAEESNPSHHWPEQAKRSIRGLIRAWHAAKDGGHALVPPEIAQPLIDEYRHAVAVGLASIPRTPGPARTTKQAPGRVLLECLRDRQSDVLRFVTDTRIEPTNNTSERNQRPEKTQQKISGRLTSETITAHRLAIRSYIITTQRHGIHTLTAIRDALTGNPWTPPGQPAT